MKNQLIFYLMITFFCSCSSNEIIQIEDEPISEETKPNILLIIADDLGKDALNGFTEGIIKPNTPNIDAIRTNGVSFTNFWTNPTCTPTRAAIITGKYGYRTGVKAVGDVLSLSETTLHSFLKTETNNAYATALVGKWHLSGNDNSVNPENYGIDYYAGYIRGTLSDYYQWQLNESGAISQNSSYNSEVYTDLSINWINNQTKPWFLWLAYNAPHTPFHVPPSNMHNQGNLSAYTNGSDPMPYYMAAIEAMDFQIGKLLSSIPQEVKNNTVIIFIGDNGTPNQVSQSPYNTNRVKGTLYQGGINMPLFVSGKNITKIGTDASLICSTDLFATITAIAGGTKSEINDSKSFLPILKNNSTTVREFQYSEINNGSFDEWTISDGIYKLIVDANGNEEMYNLTTDPYETNNLVTQNLTATETIAKNKLESELQNIRK